MIILNNKQNYTFGFTKVLGSLVKLTLIIILLPIITSCDFFTTGGSIEDWYRSEKAKIATNPNRVIIPVKPVSVISFKLDNGDPFDMRNLIKEEILEVADDRDAPDPDRPRQPLESYALDSMQFVGTIFQLELKQNIALVNAAGSLYQVRVGEYLGQSYGLVKDIRETEIVLEERVKNANNRWIRVERVINLVGLSKENLR